MRVLRDLASADSIVDSGSVQRQISSIRRLSEYAQKYGYSGTRVGLSLLKNAGVDNADNDQTGNDQSESDKGYEEDTASAGRKFTPYDPILLLCISMRRRTYSSCVATQRRQHTWLSKYLLPPTSKTKIEIPRKVAPNGFPTWRRWKVFPGLVGVKPSRSEIVVLSRKS